MAIWVAHAQRTDFITGQIGTFLSFLPDNWTAFLTQKIIAPYPGPFAYALGVPFLRGVFELPFIKAGLARIIADAPAFLDSDFVKPAVDPISADAGGQDFIGREASMAQLMNFANDNDGGGYYWTHLSGRMGQGKTRLELSDYVQQ